MFFDVLGHSFCSVNLTEKLQGVAFAPVVFFYFFESDQHNRAMKGEEVDMPRDGLKIVALGERV